MAEPLIPCEHRYITSHSKGWVCANRACGVGILSLAVPLPMPLVEKAFAVLASAAASIGEEKNGTGME